MSSSLNIFAYGSNMCLRRIRERIASAAMLSTACLTQRRLLFHKRGKDGSAKANALFTGKVSDRVWGVVFTINPAEKPLLDYFALSDIWLAS